VCLMSVRCGLWTLKLSVITLKKVSKTGVSDGIESSARGGYNVVRGNLLETRKVIVVYMCNSGVRVRVLTQSMSSRVNLDEFPPPPGESCSCFSFLFASS
jgi:hypothetical protein